MTTNGNTSTNNPLSGVSAGAIVVALALLSAIPANAGETGDVSGLKALSIQDLLEVPVTSVSRRPQKYSNAAAALFVISQEDIRRSGVTHVPELLRMVPGVQVAHIDANKWAISARGFNGRYANKLLVQLDGRTLYTPLNSGVYWDVQDTLLEDIERIEVIRGPGATLWGANAVNGIINIITRSAHDTNAGLLSLGAGNEETASAAFRHGAALGDAASFRLYAKGYEHDGSRFFSGEDALDDWHDGRIGFRADVDLSQTDSLTIQGDYYDGEAGASIAQGPLVRDAVSATSGGNMLARWNRRLGEGAGFELQLYYDHTRRSNWTLREDRDTYDLDVQHHFTAARQHDLVWGVGYHRTRDDIANIPDGIFSLEPVQRTASTFSAFIQDDLTFQDENWHLIIGAKVEHNDYTGWEWQPNVRGLWNAAEDTTLWAAISRAVRIPSRVERDVTIAVGPVVISGNPDLLSERLTAYEIGLRTQPRDNLSMDLAAFYNDYGRLQTYELIGPPFPPPIQQGIDNLMKGTSHGLELAANWDATRDWRFKAAYSWFELDLELKAGSTDMLSVPLWDRAPRHQLSLRSWLDLRHDVELDASLYYVGEQPNTEIPSYLRLDLRVGWQPVPGLELTLVGRNLLDDSHREFTRFSGNAQGQGLISTEVERSFLAQARWRF